MLASVSNQPIGLQHTANGESSTDKVTPRLLAACMHRHTRAHSRLQARLLLCSMTESMECSTQRPAGGGHLAEQDFEQARVGARIAVVQGAVLHQRVHDLRTHGASLSAKPQRCPLRLRQHLRLYGPIPCNLDNAPPTLRQSLHRVVAPPQVQSAQQNATQLPSSPQATFGH